MPEPVRHVRELSLQAAIAKTEEEFDLTERWALLERVVESRLLKRSNRLREMLLYIGEQNVRQGRVAIREQEIGAAVFGRPFDYDTSLDNIVRVNTTELRKRLEQYFATEGAAEEFILEIPRGGGYSATFHRRSQLATPEKGSSAGDHAVHTAEEHDPLPPTPTPVSAPVVRPTVQSFRHLPLLAAALITLAALAACAFLLWQNRALQARLQPWKSDPQLASLWSEFFVPGKETDIVTADTSLAVEEDMLQRQVSLEEYLSNSYKTQQGQPLSDDLQESLKLIRSRNTGSIGDFQAVRRVTALDPYASDLKFGSARDYLPEIIKNNDVILIGSRASNPWVDLYRDRINFFIDFHVEQHRSYVLNRSPQPGEQPAYEIVADRDHSIGYSVVALLPNLNLQRSVLLIGGTDSMATEAAGDFITSPEGLAALNLTPLRGRMPYFEALLRSPRVAGTTLRTEVVAIRIHPR